MLPTLIFLKVLPHGLIMLEFCGSAAAANRYPEGQMYTVQEKAWVDMQVFLQ